MLYKKGVVTALATGAIFLSTLTPLALADGSTTISGNGAVSQNSVSLNSGSTTTVTQNNTANVTNSVTSTADTGGNSANFNTGGSTVVSTGNATTNTDIMTKVNSNVANVSGCNTCTTAANANVGMYGNGAFSTNNVNANNTNSASLTQNNNANINNSVNSQTNTGNNRANYNTGGDTTVATGNAVANTAIQNIANANVATVPSGSGSGFGSSAQIAGNGAESNNTISLNGGTSAQVLQNNYANIANQVYAGSQTGNNRANYNTGGSVWLGTGAAATNTAINNLANFNGANLASCGCTTGANTPALIYGNGAFSMNTINGNLGNALSAWQNNASQISNVLTDPHAWTGNNSMRANTSDNGAPSYLLTGASQGTTNLSTSANMNMAGNGTGFNMNWGGTNYSFGFDMGSMLNQLGWW